jgi:hypothetical protein
MCLGCTISKHWFPLLAHSFDASALNDNGEKLLHLADVNLYPDLPTIATEAPDHSAEAIFASVKKFFFKCHLLKEGETGNGPYGQNFTSEECEKYWLDVVAGFKSCYLKDPSV